METGAGSVTGRDKVDPEARAGVRDGILSAIRGDVELRGGRTARRLLAAGAVGVLGALGATLLVTRHPMGHHPDWHGVIFGSIWAGLLVVTLSIALLRVRTPNLPLDRAALAGIVGLGLAGLCGAACSDQHFLIWWANTGVGRYVISSGGPVIGALCFGVITTAFIAAISSFVTLGRSAASGLGALVAAAAVFLLLVPGVALQTVGMSIGVSTAWLAGTGVGALLGSSGSARVRAILLARPPDRETAK